MTQHTDLSPYDTPPARQVSDGAVGTRPGGVQIVVAPFSVSIGHSFELTALALCAVGLKLAYDHRGREIPLGREVPLGRDVPLRSEYFDPGMSLSELEAIAPAQPENTVPKLSPNPRRRSLLRVLQDMTIR
jgi:hypothetical protein